MIIRACCLNALLFLFSISTFSFADNQLCDLIGKQNIVNNDTIIECIDFASINNDTITVYGDVSSISKNGLALCPLIEIEVENPDIVYILDQSGSMPAKTVHIYEDTDDTIISYVGPGNFNIQAADTIASPWEFGFKDLPRFYNALNKNNSQRANYSGDPFGLSAVALHKTLDYQAARSKTSTAGFCGLHNMAAHPFSPKPLNNNNLTEIKDSIFINEYVGRTYFYPSLAQAKEWLTDTLICKNERQMIILISDGCPTSSVKGADDKWDYLELINENDNNYPGILPPVYGVFLGYEGTTNYTPLQDLSDTTGGSFHIVPPNDPDSLVGVLRALIEKSFETPPLDISLTNTSIFPNQTSKVDENSVIQQADGSWQMILDSSLGLLPGLNKIDVEIMKTTWEGISDTVYYSFHINVEDIPEDIDSSFEEICYDKVSCKVKNSEGMYTSTLKESDTLCELYFNVYKGTSLSEFPVKMVSTQFHDTEFVILNIKDISIENVDSTRLLLFNEFNFISNDTIKPTTKNDTIETCAIDTIILTWQNPKNTKDNLIDTIYIMGTEIIYNAISASIFDTSENGSADLLKVTFDKKVPKAFILQHAYWNRRDSNFDMSSDPIMEIDSNIIYYKFNNEFKENLTSVNHNTPNDAMPIIEFKDEEFYKLNMEEVNITDSIKVSPVKADLYFGDVHQPNSNDTLVIEISEFIQNCELSNIESDFLRVSFGYTYNNDDPTFGYENSTVFNFLECINLDTIDNRVAFTFLINVKDEFINKNALIYLNQDSNIKDLVGNTSNRKGINVNYHSKLFFSHLLDPEIPINLYTWPQYSEIQVNMKGASFSDNRDTIEIQLSTDDNDSLLVKLYESDLKSGEYKGIFNSCYKANFEKNNVIEGVYESQYLPDTTIINGTISLLGEQLNEELIFIYQEKPPIEPTILYVENKNNVKVKYLSDNDSLINVILDIHRENVSDTSFVNIYTSKFHDSEKVMLTLEDSLINSDTIRIILSKMLSFISCDTLHPEPNNNRIETSANDIIYLSWKAKDQSDEAFDTVIVIGSPIVFNPINAYAFDNNDNGKVDLMKVYFDIDIPKSFDVKTISWPNSNINNTKNDPFIISCTENVLYIDLTDNEFGADMTNPFFSNPPKVIFNDEAFYNLGKNEVEVHDSVGAAPVSAILMKSSKGSIYPDTIIVNVSEAIKIDDTTSVPLRINDLNIFNPNVPSLGYSDSKILKKEPDTDIIIHNGSNENSLTVLLSKKENSIKKGSVLYLNDSSALVDNFNNFCSRKGIPLKIYGKLFFTKIGVNDSAVSEFAVPFDSILIAALQIESITDKKDTLILNLSTLSGDMEELLLIETDSLSGLFKGHIKIDFKNDITNQNNVLESKFVDQDINCADSIFGAVTHDIQTTEAKAIFKHYVSPRIEKAIYYYSEFSTNRPDTLKLKFNIPVTIDLTLDSKNNGIYNYWNGINDIIDQVVSNKLKENTKIINSMNAEILVSRDYSLTPFLDSIKFIPNSDYVISNDGVNPGNSPYCPIIYNNAPKIVVEIAPNPIKLSEGQIKNVSSSSFNDESFKGALILISSRIQIKNATVKVFDLVGEELYKAKAKYDKEHKYLYTVWNGENKNKRVCGAGTYIVTVKITDVNENVINKKLYLGIKDIDAKKLKFF